MNVADGHTTVMIQVLIAYVDVHRFEVVLTPAALHELLHVAAVFMAAKPAGFVCHLADTVDVLMQCSAAPSKQPDISTVTAAEIFGKSQRAQTPLSAAVAALRNKP